MFIENWQRMALIACLSCCFCLGESQQIAPLQVVYDHIGIKGALAVRMNRSMDRLEESKYQPDNVFLTEEQSGGWPGDTEGRTILALALEAQATHRTPAYLDEIVRRIPGHLNERGYMGPIYKGMANEQQLSGNGWMLRGLCELYAWKKDKQVLEIIRNMARNLFLPAIDKFARYPINPEERRKDIGAESGSIAGLKDGWMLSTDIGCVFIGMEGLIHAYTLLGDQELIAPIEALIGRFLEMDLTAIKAQTHATLTACRGLVRYADYSGRKELVEEAARRFGLYRENGMTENHENYNWFDRYDTWTEPCAIVDSYMLAVQLWQHTMDPMYLEEAENIYFNAICHTQRYNGGFGCDNCPGIATGTQELALHCNEAHWCCTMRGGEGLASAARYTFFTGKRQVFMPFLRTANLNTAMEGKNIQLEMVTDYPFGNNVEIQIGNNDVGTVELLLAAPSWTKGHTVSINGKKAKATRKKGFLAVKGDFRKGDRIAISFSMETHWKNTLNKHNTEKTWRKIAFGPLLLGVSGKGNLSIAPDAQFERLDRTTWSVKGTDVRLKPIYHLMDDRVWTDKDYHKQILF